MKTLTFLLALFYLQGCTTLKLNESFTSKSIEMAKGVLPFNYNIDEIWIDDKEQTYNICISDLSNLHKQNEGKFGLTIPFYIQENNDSLIVNIEYREVPEPAEFRNGWIDYNERMDIKVYDIDLIVKDKCKEKSNYDRNLKLLNSLKNIKPIDAISFTGKTIKDELNTNEKFAVFVPDQLYNLSSKNYFVCNTTSNNPCLYIVTKPNAYNDQFGKKYTEIYSIKKLVWDSDTNPIWYLTVPFALVLDLAIVFLELMGSGAMGAPGGIV